VQQSVQLHVLAIGEGLKLSRNGNGVDGGKKNGGRSQEKQTKARKKEGGRQVGM
jgi:hypothetical protein